MKKSALILFFILIFMSTLSVNADIISPNMPRYNGNGYNIYNYKIESKISVKNSFKVYVIGLLIIVLWAFSSLKKDFNNSQISLNKGEDDNEQG